MRWRGGKRSSNVEDRRGMAPKAAMGGGIIGILVLVVVVILGGDPKMVQQFLGGAAEQGGQVNAAGTDDDAREFIEVTLKYTEDVWHDLLDDYREPRLEIFSDRTQTACGLQSSKVGPFYCPADEKIYIDPGFFVELKRRHNAEGDFAMAYVIAHEVAHHVQRLMGYSAIVDRVRNEKPEAEVNRWIVRLELQADYLAGVWAHHAHKKLKILEEGDPEEAINAADQIGDDTLQRKAGFAPKPERYTHGTSKQRVYWFKKGLLSGDVQGAKQLFELRYEDL